MSRYNVLPVRVTDTAGRPLSGAKLFFYATGTTTYQNTYTTAALSTANANPVVCNSAGLIPAVYLDPDLTYDVVVTDSAGDTGSPIFSCLAIGGAGLATKPVDAETGASYTVVSGDRGHIIKRTHSAAMTVTLPTANGAAIGNGFPVTIWNATSLYDITVSVTSSGTIDGSSSRVIKPGQRIEFISTGSEWTADEADLTTGKRPYPYPAAAWKETATNGCAAIARLETTTNKNNYDYLAFDGATAEFAYCVTTTPPSYLAGSMEYRVIWTSAAGTPGEAVKWGLAARCYADDAAADQAYGSVTLVDDVLLATGDVHVTAWTAFTPAGEAADALLLLRATRDAPNDTLNNDAYLICVELRMTLTA